MYRIESINARTRTDGDESDLPWQEVTLPPTVDATNLGAVLRQVEDLEFDETGLRYRVMETEPVSQDFWIGAEMTWVRVESYRRIRRVA